MDPVICIILKLMIAIKGSKMLVSKQETSPRTIKKLKDIFFIPLTTSIKKEDQQPEKLDLKGNRPCIQETGLANIASINKKQASLSNTFTSSKRNYLKTCNQKVTQRRCISDSLEKKTANVKDAHLLVELNLLTSKG